MMQITKFSIILLLARVSCYTVYVQSPFPIKHLVEYPGVDLGLLQWWGCSSNAREARAKNFGLRPLN